MQTPYTIIVALVGISTGIILARTRKYKRVYIIAYAIATLALFVMWQFTAVTPIWWYVLVTSLAGFGIGMIGAITTLVALFAVPKRLLGAAVGAIFFFQMIGLVVAPSILGLAQNSTPELESGLKLVFLVGAAAMMFALFMILTIPEISMEVELPEKGQAVTPAVEVAA